MDPRIKTGTPLSDVAIDAVESALGRDLPADYRAFVAAHGDAFVGGYVDDADALPVLSLFNDAQIRQCLATQDDLRVEGLLPFGSCELNNLWVIDCKVDHSVHYINYYGGQTKAHRVADTFEDFIQRIVIRDEEA